MHLCHEGKKRKKEKSSISPSPLLSPPFPTNPPPHPHPPILYDKHNHGKKSIPTTAHLQRYSQATITQNPFEASTGTACVYGYKELHAFPGSKRLRTVFYFATLSCHLPQGRSLWLWLNQPGWSRLSVGYSCKCCRIASLRQPAVNLSYIVSSLAPLHTPPIPCLGSCTEMNISVVFAFSETKPFPRLKFAGVCLFVCV